MLRLLVSVMAILLMFSKIKCFLLVVEVILKKLMTCGLHPMELLEIKTLSAMILLAEKTIA
jgi:hypothetical protein